MGLRMFVEPDSPESKCAIKTDPTATARSSIRRQRNLRQSANSRNDHSVGTQSALRRSIQETGPRSSRMDRHTLLEDIRRHRRGSIPQASGPMSQSMAQDQEMGRSRGSNTDGYIVDSADGQATHRSRVEVAAMQEARNRAWAESRGHENETTSAGWPADLRGSSRLRDGQLRGMQTQSSTAQVDGTLVHGATHSLDPAVRRQSRRSIRSARFTPGFAPAHRLTGSEMVYSQRLVDIASLSNRIRDLQYVPHGHEDATDLSAMLHELNLMMTRASASPTSDSMESDTAWIDIMRRHVDNIQCRSAITAAGERSRHTASDNEHNWRHLHRDGSADTHTHRDDSDGLGDRERSLSPEAVSWETMLATITPDDQTPSTQSSFASIRASASTAASFVESTSTAASSLPNAEPCPVSEDFDSNLELGRTTRRSANDRISPDDVGLVADSSTVDAHLDRIESLSRRLRQQRSQGEYVARHRRIVEREAELQRLEMTLQRLERQIEGERANGIGETQRPSDAITNRGRL